jgi:hypothetical protein
MFRIILTLVNIVVSFASRRPQSIDGQSNERGRAGTPSHRSSQRECCKINSNSVSWIVGLKTIEHFRVLLLLDLLGECRPA